MALDTAVDICNAALLRAGITRRIENLTDSSNDAEACNAEYDNSLEAVLEDHHWQFAKVYTRIATSVATPDWYWKYQYDLPDDCLVFLGLEAENIPYEQSEGNVLLTNEPAPLKIRYTKKVEDLTDMPPSFKQALVLHLAAALAMGLTKDLDRAERLEAKYKEKVGDARFLDSGRKSYQPLDASGFIDARSAGPEAIDTEGQLQ